MRAMDDKTLDAAVDSWSIHAPDGEGCVYFEQRRGDAIRLLSLGRRQNVLERLAEWCAANDRE
jgi:hypothetical protein